ncbi:excisionase family DNA-binding protein [Dactylosporangium sp. CS-033363]|uniref:excisionase family DNA-binding protein n=1 Tax=Dactylosporangium sp. CS-033363 TaxID=3239935 RepID=UPI003D904115
MRKILPPRPVQRAASGSASATAADHAPERPAPGKALNLPQNARERASRDRYLTVAEVAEVLGTTERFPRRLIEERRIEFKRFGRHVRIAASVLDAYIEASTVAPRRRRAA